MKNSSPLSCRALPLLLVVIATILFSSSTVVSSEESSTRLQQQEEDNDQSLLDFCRSVGFDPWQLSCETCDLLLPLDREDIQKNCKACCQSYKTSQRMTKPYESAILVHRVAQSSSADSEMEQFLRDDWEELVKTKGSTRLFKMARDDTTSSARFLLMRPPSQMLLWFDRIVEPGKKLKEYKEMAKEIIYLDGYKKDDMKDMVATLLPDGTKK